MITTTYMNTALDFLKTLPEPLRAEALEFHKPNFQIAPGEGFTDSEPLLENAILYGFEWDSRHMDFCWDDIWFACVAKGMKGIEAYLIEMDIDYSYPGEDKVETSDAEHLTWMHNRFVEVYGEDPEVDFLIKFREIIEKIA